MIITDIAVKKRTTIFVAMLLFALSGVYAYLILPREAAPDIPIPIMLVMTMNRGVSPEDIENTITLQMERELEGLDDLKKMSSFSAEGMSTVVLEFNPSIDVDEAYRKVKDAVDKAKNELPQEADPPMVQEINVSEFPIMVLSIHGQADPDRVRNLQALKKVAQELQDAIEMVPGVLEVKRVGGLTPEVRIEIDPDKLSAYRIPAALLVSRYMGEDVNISGGSTEFGNQNFDIRVPMQFERDIESAKNIVITQMGDQSVHLGDLAEIVPGFEKEDTKSRFNGEEAVSLMIQKRTGENLIATAAGVKYILEMTKKSGMLPPGVSIDLTMDQSEFIQALVMDLDNNIATGFFLVVGVVFLALGFRNSFFVAVAIPLSFLITLTIFWVIGQTLNFVVLFSLILALGMLVDNAIVIVENIFRHQQMGHDRIEAAILGTREVAWPITTSTLTTVAAFAPLLIWPGIVGKFMGFLPKTVIIALAASLLVGLVMNPVICAVFMRIPKGAVWGSEGRKKGRFLTGYSAVLAFSIRHKVIVSVFSFIALFGTIALYFSTKPGIEFFPSTDPQRAFVDITLPEGTRVEKTDEWAKRAESIIKELDTKGDIEQVVTSVGSEGTTSHFSSGGSRPHFTRVAVEFVDIDKRKTNSRDLIEAMRKRFGELAGAEILVAQENMGPPSGAAVSIELHGTDYKILGNIAAEVRGIVRKVAGVVDLRDDYEPGRPELRIAVDRKRAALLDLSPLLVGLTVQTAYQGRKVGVVRSGEEEFDVRVIAKEEDKAGFDLLDKLYLMNATGKLVPASAVASWEIQGGKGSIRHIDRDRVVTVSASVAKDFNAADVRKACLEVLKDFQEEKMPYGYKLLMTGEQEMMSESEDFLGVAFIGAVFLIALILITQFNSIRLPLIIISSVVLSLVGVFAGLTIMGKPFGVVMTGVGVISLAGVVVNNAIVLVDYIQKLREKGMCAFDALIEAGITRLRPVLLTAVTTVFGLLPMGLGISIDFHHGRVSWAKEMGMMWGPMATTVIFGLSVATILTLVVLPTLYALLMGVREEKGRAETTACEAPHE